MTADPSMDANLALIYKDIYEACAFKISDFDLDAESSAYAACSFQLNGRKVLSRNAKITPKKAGQFVTFWKRTTSGIIAPFAKEDAIDFYVVTVRTENSLGQFVFPLSILMAKGIVATEKKEGKRAFRVYPSWDVVQSKQAARTQQWQLPFFYEINESTDLEKVKALFVK